MTTKLTVKELNDKWLSHLQDLKDKKVKLSPSSFKAFCESPLHYKKYLLSKWDGSFKPTTAIKRGNIVDSIVFGKESDYKVLSYDFEARPDQRSNGKGGKMGMTSNANKAWLKSLMDTLGGEEKIVEESFYNDCVKMGEAVWECPQALELLSVSEFALKKQWEIDGVLFRGELDIYSQERNEVSDLKTCQTVKYHKFRNTAIDRMYVEQVTMYIMGCEGNPSGSLVAVDGDCCCEVFTIDFRTQNKAERLIRDNLVLFKKCLAEDSWHQGYSFYNNGNRWHL